jgi:hypothetical protein
VWNIYFGPIEQTVCPNTTGGDIYIYIYILKTFSVSYSSRLVQFKNFNLNYQ